MQEKEKKEKVNKGGRPLKFKSVKELEEKIADYFDSCYEPVPKIDDDGKPLGEIAYYKNIRPLTVTGLAVHLDTSRKVLLEYQDERPEFSNAIKKAKERIQSWVEEQLYRNTQVAGVIFNLKNNFDWREKREIEHSGSMAIAKMEETLREYAKIDEESSEDEGAGQHDVQGQ